MWDNHGILDVYTSKAYSDTQNCIYFGLFGSHIISDISPKHSVLYCSFFEMILITISTWELVFETSKTEGK